MAYHSASENNDSSAIEQFAWIPQQILHSITATLEVKWVFLNAYLNTIQPFQSRDIAEQVIADYILPLPGKNDDDIIWVDRLLTTMNHLDDKALNVLMSISGIKNGYEFFH